MQYKEFLYWTVYKPGSGMQNQEKEIEQSVAFVHSLGLKCDSVGWTEIDLADPRAEEILQAITHFCGKDGWVSRGVYHREYDLQDTQWFELQGTQLQDDTVGDFEMATAQDGREIRLWRICAYRELSVEPKQYYGKTVIVPERFRDVYLQENMEGLDFCWVRDTGRYAGHQYYHVFGNKLIPRVGVSWDTREDPKVRNAAGGWLPRVAEVIDQLFQIDMQDCYLEEDLPKGGITYAYIPGKTDLAALDTILLHKDTAQVLLREKAIRPASLRPALVCKQLPGGYTLRETAPCPRPAEVYRQQMDEACEKLKVSNRPVRKVTEKEALKLLRKARKERSAAFRKKLSQADAALASDSLYAPMLPYYGVSDGGWLSDEYEIFSFKGAIAAQTQLLGELAGEELLQEKPDGVVIGRCANGDRLLLLADGQVIRFSHEAPQTTDRWLSLPMFLADALGG